MKYVIDEQHEWFCGEDRTFRFFVRDDEGKLEDVSTWAVEWCVREQGSSDVLITKTSLKGVRPRTDLRGALDISVLSADTKELPPGEYEHFLWRTDGGKRLVLAHGPALLQSSIASF